MRRAERIGTNCANGTGSRADRSQPFVEPGVVPDVRAGSGPALVGRRLRATGKELPVETGSCRRIGPNSINVNTIVFFLTVEGRGVIMGKEARCRGGDIEAAPPASPGREAGDGGWDGDIASDGR